MSSSFRCRHPDCIYRNPEAPRENTHSFHNACNYAGITGKTRLGQLPPDMWDPKRCPLYDTGKVKNPKKVFNIPPPRKPAAPEWEPKAMELYKAGYMDTEIAAMLNVKYHQVAAFRERNKLPRNALKRERFKFDKNLALKLYKEGKNDREIAAEIGVARTSIGKWRDANGLPPNAEPCCTPAIYDFTPAMKLYEEGKNDREIAAVIGCSPQYIGKWRKKNNLPSNAEPRSTPAIYDFTPALKLYEEGKNDKQIAAVIGCSPQYIGKWRKKNNLPSKFVQKKGESHE